MVLYKQVPRSICLPPYDLVFVCEAIARKESTQLTSVLFSKSDSLSHLLSGSSTLAPSTKPYLQEVKDHVQSLMNQLEVCRRRCCCCFCTPEALIPCWCRSRRPCCKIYSRSMCRWQFSRRPSSKRTRHWYGVSSELRECARLLPTRRSRAHQYVKRTTIVTMMVELAYAITGYFGMNTPVPGTNELVASFDHPFDRSTE